MAEPGTRLSRRADKNAVASLAARRSQPRGAAIAEPTLRVVDLGPQRYRTLDDGNGPRLTCIEAPTVSLSIERGLSVSASAARAAAPGSIFLDGAAQGAPFADASRCVYNLDHHEGCVRAFTLSACEQAMVLVRKHIDLRSRDWTLYANDADLDTVLAVWILMNHLRLSELDDAVRSEVMPLLRLQGAIDAHGLELQDLCALPPELYRKTRSRMDVLRGPELDLKKRGVWNRVDLLEFVADRLRAIDRLIYEPAQLADVGEIEELARAPLGADSVVVVCRSELGIYEVERQLRRFHGRRLGLIALQKDSATYALRQVDPSLNTPLDRLYNHLNVVDPAAGGNRSPNRWGGSTEIGGSPRASGTRLSPREIAEVCRLSYRRPSRWWRFLRGSVAVSLATLIGLCALAPVTDFGAAAIAQAWPGAASVPPLLGFACLWLVCGGGLSLLAARSSPRAFGLCRPTGLEWLLAIPVALAAALAGGVFSGAPPPALRAVSEFGLGLAMIGAAPVGIELLFRGLVQSRLAEVLPMRASRLWPPSRAVLFTALLYAAWISLAQAAAPDVAHPVAGSLHAILRGVAAFAFGITLGSVRERSESLVPPLALHALAIATIWTCSL